MKRSFARSLRLPARWRVQLILSIADLASSCSGQPLGALVVLQRNMLIYGLGGLVVPFVGIKAIDIIITTLNLA